ncbi:MAG TPA: MoaD/ThiS family protein [Aquifex aeolicus]|uniref:Molybdopterin synthase sulfur carrier subunit n=1 Tax=Aquifex aeolicus TaxID=63363 RepID=A0A7C5QEI6_AQUAO|nr:MoaD/ThiS family protein [Aquifex aeolicus]
MPRVIYFSVVREGAGRSEEDIEFSGQVGDLRKLLKERYPQLGDIIEQVRFAVDNEYVGDDYSLRGNETVAVIPPVSGG